MYLSFPLFSMTSAAMSEALCKTEAGQSCHLFSGRVDSQQVWLAEMGSAGDRHFISLDERNFYQLHVAASGRLRAGADSIEASCAVLTRPCCLPALALSRHSGRIDLFMNDLLDPEMLTVSHFTQQFSARLLEDAAFWVFPGGQNQTVEGALRKWWLENISADLSSPILYIEDDAIISLCMSDQLRGLGFTNFFDTMKGCKAMEIFRSRPDIRVVLSDYDLREARTGLDLVREMRKSQPGLRVLFVSGQSRAIESQLTEDEKGAFVVVPKHTEATTIGRILQELLVTPH